jgi:hypothetical protein
LRSSFYYMLLLYLLFKVIAKNNLNVSQRIALACFVILILQRPWIFFFSYSVAIAYFVSIVESYRKKYL